MTFSGYRRPLWLYPLFQIPAIFFGLFLILALLFGLLGFGKPPLSVAIALDLSGSTYQNSVFNGPGTLMNQEIQAVQSYLAQSSQLKQPNSVKTWGFATDIIPLTANFNTDGTKIIQELNASLQSDLPQRIGGGTNVDLAIQQGSDALALSKGCRHLLIVTDGAVEINPEIVKKAFNQGVKISAIVVEADSVPLRTAAFLTGGKYLIGEKTTLESLFTETLFKDWNNNWRWVIFWLGLAWIAFHWLLVLPLDRWVLQGWLKKRIDDSARIALGNALSWTILTPLILWQLYRLLNLVAPFVAQC